MPSTCTGWHMGISSAVRLAPMIPATWATASTSPFFIPPSRIRARVSRLTYTRAPARALRRVGAFSPTSTIRA